MRQILQDYFAGPQRQMVLERDFGLRYHLVLPLSDDAETARQREQELMTLGLEYVAGITPDRIMEFTFDLDCESSYSPLVDNVGSQLVLDKYIRVAASSESPFISGSQETDNRERFREEFHTPNIVLSSHPTLSSRYVVERDDELAAVEADFAFRALYDIVDFKRFRRNGLFGQCLLGRHGLVIQDTFVKFVERV